MEFAVSGMGRATETVQVKVKRGFKTPKSRESVQISRQKGAASSSRADGWRVPNSQIRVEIRRRYATGATSF